MPQCCVPQCNNRSGGHSFPKDKCTNLKWLVAVRRDKWKPTKNSLVCSQHFKEDDYKQLNYYGNAALKKVLKPGAVPSVFLWNELPTKTVINRQKRAATRQSKDNENEQLGSVPAPDNEVNIRVEAPENVENPTLPITFMEVSTQTPDRCVPPRDIHHYWNNNDAIHFFTGLESYDKFIFVLSTLGPAATELNYRWGVPCKMLSVENCFFLTVLKLRQNKCNVELSLDFDISETMVSSIFITWINFMYCQWKEIDWWPDQETTRFFHPHNFNSPSTRVIYDATEFPIQRPKNPTAAQASFSTYKNKHTLKVIVGSSPGGLISCITPAYGGSASDRQIVSTENLHVTCDAGDTVMADKGFNVQDLFAPYNVRVSIPTFLRGTSQLSASAVIGDRKLSNRRVHIERIIGLTKTYKILRTPLQSSEVALGSRISFVCATLCNFRKSIMPPRC